MKQIRDYYGAAFEPYYFFIPASYAGGRAWKVNLSGGGSFLIGAQATQYRPLEIV
jgi:hypothetical protein